MATINTIEDLIQLLDDNPHWVEALRARLLTRELIELPEKFAAFVEATNQRFDRIEERLGGMEESLDRGDARMDRVEGRLDRLADDVGILKGAHARSTALREADMIAEDMGFTLVRVLSRFTGRPARAAVAGARLDERIRDRLESEGVFWYELSPESLDVE